MWGDPSGFRMEELDSKLFQVFFDEESSMQRVLDRGPWLFRNSWVILDRWKRNMRNEEYKFNQASVWIQNNRIRK